MMLPIALGVMASVGRLIIGQVEGEDRPERLRFGAALMLVITYGITVGGLLLPIGSPRTPDRPGPDRGPDGRADHLFEWFLMALPIVVVMFVALLVVILFLNRPEVQRVEGPRSSSPSRAPPRPAVARRAQHPDRLRPGHPVDPARAGRPVLR
jgi:sodium-dependent dicarboxylate transporter 2/3/5